MATDKKLQLLLIHMCVGVLAACSPIPAGDISNFEDLGAPRANQDVSRAADMGSEALGEDGVSAAPMRDSDCMRDADCASPMWCSDDGRCVDTSQGSIVPIVMDGATRAGVAGFDLVPEHFELWHDRASPDCPNNRVGYFDGRLDVPKPTAPCADAFDDLDGDGLFNAVWLGGPDLDRPALGVEDDNPPQGRVVVFTRDELVIVLLSLDLYALDRGRLDQLTRQLSDRLGLPQRAFVVHTTGNRSGPDAVGLSGPSWRRIVQDPSEDESQHPLQGLDGLMELPMASGIHSAWWGDFVRRTDAAIRRATQMRKMVNLRQAFAQLPIRRAKFGGETNSDEQADSDDFNGDETPLDRWRARRWPFVRDENIPSKLDDTVRLIALDSVQSGSPYILLAGWGGAPALSKETNKLSADYPGRIRQRLETLHPGSTVVWLTSAAADTHVVDSRVFIPDVDADGQLLDASGEITDDPLLARGSQNRMEALTQLIVARLNDSLAEAPSEPAELKYKARSVWVPIGNPRLSLAASLGLLPRHRDWLSGQMSTNAWVSRDAVPACGGLGCLRYRLDRIDLSPGFSLITAPGALDQSYVLGRRGLTVHYQDGRNYLDLDGDGRGDAEDDDGIVVSAHLGSHARSFEVHEAVNPQTFDSVVGLGAESVWVVGRTNGGWGSFRSAGERVNVFEGQIDALVQETRDPEIGDIRISALGYSVLGELTLSHLLERLVAAAPQLLANLSSSHELDCRVDMPQVEGPVAWLLRGPDGALLADGEDLILGPGTRVYSPSVNFGVLRVPDGSMLSLPDLRDQGWAVERVVPLVLRDHPNAGDAWASTAAAGGDFVYNGLCELVSDEGVCLTSRAIRRDPNPQLPRMRHSFP